MSVHPPSRGRVGMRSLSVAAILSLVAVAGAGCSTGSSGSSSSTSTAASSSAAASSTSGSSASASGSTSYPAGKEDVCQARDQLKTSIDALTSTQLLAEGTNAIKAGVDQVETDFDALKAAAKDDYQAPVSAMQTSLEELQTAVGNLGSGDAAANLKAVGAAIATTGASANTLFTQLKTTCGS